MNIHRQNNCGDTALMVFSLSSKREAERKALFGPYKKRLSRNLFELLIDQTKTITKASCGDVVWIDETKQRGNTFAERFGNAFKDVFALGYDKVLAIGNDCPELTTDILLQGIDQLNHQDLVLGPSSDGGIYLIGFSKAIFNEQRFCMLPWMSDNLFSSIIQQARARNIDFHCFSPLSDIDKKSAVIQYAKRNPGTLIFRLVSSFLIFNHSFNFEDQTLSIHPFAGHRYLLRAPPVYC
ncbi:DUF2064 domain-containing protein [Membranicola marinus]|uniref:DUF2064 domain-containing protein n=1 Tax=Membranihabitans marinus TaxID=1227546 RepID=A0A953HV39_9BACT|nr:DUF2064 domain-containing protein [Membranihabitans marinus]MBY5958746.1 DUF2064 domain-containing protein [Membranihabitans marinus]